ncbi:MAG TPA: Crp/Fnr family transcriptional regulator [Hyphomicrobium sp.]|nr:Crp/Fnr family transcriptional regulator [Hyphomicrobium sp.]
MSGSTSAFAARADRRQQAIYLTELELEEGHPRFFQRLNPAELAAVRLASRIYTAGPNEPVFTQGETHNGIFLIEAGRIRTFYVGPSGKELTLAYWTPGHFVGGPEVFGGGTHIWSAETMEVSRIAHLPGAAVRHLAETIPAFALCLIDALVAKGKCYSALAQMLGTRSVTARLAQLLLILSAASGGDDDRHIERKITHEHLAGIIGSTRQWVTATLARFQKRGLISVSDDRIAILQPKVLRSEG